MRNFAITDFNYEKIEDTADTNNNICNQYYYCIGTLFANALFKAQKNLGYDQTVLTGPKSRGEFFTLIINSLKETRRNIIHLPDLPPKFNSCQMANETSGKYNGAVLGAVFLDGGFDKARNVVRKLWHEQSENPPELTVDAKSELQEWAQGQGLALPKYTVVSRKGPDHAPHFTAEVMISGKGPAQGEGASKRIAEQEAASALLKREGVRSKRAGF